MLYYLWLVHLPVLCGFYRIFVFINLKLNCGSFLIYIIYFHTSDKLFKSFKVPYLDFADIDEKIASQILYDDEENIVQRPQYDENQPTLSSAVDTPVVSD